jgi:hypothetical protein
MIYSMPGHYGSVVDASLTASADALPQPMDWVAAVEEDLEMTDYEDDESSDSVDSEYSEPPKRLSTFRI